MSFPLIHISVKILLHTYYLTNKNIFCCEATDKSWIEFLFLKILYGKIVFPIILCVNCKYVCSNKIDHCS